MNEYLNKLKGPAIGLIVTGSLNLLWGLINTASNIYMYLSKGGIYAQQQSGYYNVGVVIGILIVILSMLLAPLIIWGGIRMMKAKSYNLARIAAVIAILPVSSCCFILGLPFGIWALVILSDSNVKALFYGGNGLPFDPPSPPTF